jgi:hypothetical protein
MLTDPAKDHANSCTYRIAAESKLLFGDHLQRMGEFGEIYKQIATN